jgi:hypothetical protein
MARKAARKTDKPKRSARYWSADVTRNSNALDLEKSVFAKKKPRDIALSLKRSAEH